MAAFITNNERTNYARLCRAIVDLCTQLLQDLLYRQVPLTANLRNKICRCPDLRSAGLKPNQWTYINNTATTGSYREFDITLLYLVIRLLSVQDLRDELGSNINPRKRNRNQNQIMTAVQNCPALISDPATALSASELAEIKNADNVGSFDQCKDGLLWKLFKRFCPFPNPSIIHPTEPWGSSNMPHLSRTSPGDDIERIRLIRNTVYGHIPTTAVSDTDYNKQWAILEDIMTRMNLHLGGHYREDLDKIKIVSMDDASKKSFCDEIEKLSAGEREQLEEIQKVADDVANVSSTVTQLQSSLSEGEAKIHSEIEIIKNTVDQKVEQIQIQLHEEMEAQSSMLQEDVDKLKSNCEEDRQNTSKSLTDMKESFSLLLEKQLQSTVDQKLEKTRTQFHEEIDTHVTKLQTDVDKLTNKFEENRPSTSKSLTEMEESFSKRMEEVTSKLTEVEEGIKKITEDNSEEQEHEEQISSLEKRTALMIDQHRDDKTFVVTEAVNKGIKILNDHGMLIFSGLPGDGKTKNALEIMANYKESSSDWLFLKLDDVRMWSDVHPDINSVILFDDFLGSRNTDAGLICDCNEYWTSIHACIEKGQVKVILTIRKNILVKNLTKIEKYKIFSKVHTLDLTSDEIKLTKDEKWNILKRHFDNNSISISDEDNYKCVDDKTPVTISYRTVKEIIDTDTLFGFPEACFMFCSKRKYTRLGVKFFRNPTQDLIDEIDNLMEQDLNGKIQYCIMSYMLLKGGKIDFNNLDSDTFAEVTKSLKLPDMPNTRELNTAKKYLTERYIAKTGQNDSFQFIHQTIQEAIALCFYNDNPLLLLQVCSEHFIEEYIKPQDYLESEAEIVLRLKHNEYKYLIDRFISSLQQSNGESARFDWWMKHPILDDVQFVNDMMNVIGSDNVYKQMIQNCISNHQLFNCACLHGKTHLVDKLYNVCEVKDMSTENCLVSSSCNGHTDTVIWLLDNKVGLEGVVNALQKASTLLDTDTLISMIKHENVTLSNVIDVLDIISDIKTVEVVLNRWPDIEQKYLLKILCSVSVHGNYEAVDVIIKKRSDVITQEVITDCFRWACMGGHIDEMNFYLNMEHKNINCKMIYVLQNDDNLTNLHIAAFLGRFNVFIKLTELGLCITDKTKNGLNVLQVAMFGYTCQGLDTHRVSYMIQSTSVILSEYCEQSHFTLGNLTNFKQLFSFLIDHADTDKTDLDKTVDGCNRTLVHYCVVHNDPSMIELLCKKYPSVLYVPDKFNNKPIHLALLLGRSEIFQILYSMNTDLESNKDNLDSLISRGRQYAGKSYDMIFSIPESFDDILPQYHLSLTFGESKDYESITTTIQENEESSNN